MFTGACPKPVVTALKRDDEVLLECDVLGASPKPEVELQDSAGIRIDAKDMKVSEKGGYYDIILSAAVTKTGSYRCAVKQTEICHQIYSKDIWINPGELTLWHIFGIIIIHNMKLFLFNLIYLIYLDIW